MNLDELLELSNKDLEKITDGPTLVADLKKIEAALTKSDNTLDEKLQVFFTKDVERLASMNSNFSLTHIENILKIQIGKGGIFLSFAPTSASKRFSIRYYFEIIRSGKKDSFHVELLPNKKDLVDEIRLGHDLSRKLEKYNGVATNLSADDIDRIAKYKTHLESIIQINESIQEDDLIYRILKTSGGNLVVSTDLKEIVEKALSTTHILK